jgi:hypothetical protein
MVQIKADITLPTKDNLWLLRLTGVNRQKYKRPSQDMYRVEHYLYANTYVIAPIVEEPNCTFDKLQEFTVSGEDISYQFTFWGEEFGAKSIAELKDKVRERIKNCQKHIEKAQKAQTNLLELLAQLTGGKIGG